jgi:N-methylhydantoinase A
MKRISVDIGGTFTDCFLVWEDKKLETKALTTHHNLALGFMEALERACNEVGLEVTTVLSQVDSVRYATTLGTNALLERKGPKVGLITTAGYESSVPLSRGRGYGEGLTPREQQDLASARRPEPLVTIPMIAGARERVDYRGAILMPLDEEHLRTQIRHLVDQGAQAFVVALVNSVVNPAHEKRVEEILLEEYPAHMLGSMPIILSHQVVGRKGEYARTTSAILDAYLHEQMYHALSALEMTLKDYGYTRPMLVVHNTGGMAQLNSTHALQTIHSGPTSGINVAERLAEEFKTGKLIAMDIGGTSCDIGLVVGGGIKFYDFNPVIDRWLVNVPMLHLKIIGAGGGSIARYNQIFHSIEVGPESAGSDPGPACYDRGGMQPTVTDADLLLGYLAPERYASGTVSLNRRRAEFAVRENICEEMGIDVIEAALQIKQKVDTNMAHAMFQELGVKGYDAKDFTLLAYGGNGPMHACGIADVLGIRKILVPPFSSIFSAVGAGLMNQLHIHERNVFLNIYDSNTRKIFDQYAEFNRIVEELESEAREDLLRQGMDERDVRFRLELDMRYGNQRTETSVISPTTRLAGVQDVMKLISAFSENYGERFGAGSQSPETGIRINTIRVIGYVELSTIQFDKQEGAIQTEPSRTTRTRTCYFVGSSEPVQTAIYNVEALTVGARVKGPAIIEAPHTTYLVEPGWLLTMGTQGSAWVEKEASL